MNSETGEIRSRADWGRIFKNTDKKKENLVPFEEGETVEIKGCSFKVRAIKPAPTNMITLEGIPQERHNERTILYPG